MQRGSETLACAMLRTPGTCPVKRRSLPRRARRDFEAETLKKLTVVSITQNEMRDRLLADKAALEAKLKLVFDFRKEMNFERGGTGEAQCNELVRSISAELRHVKRQL